MTTAMADIHDYISVPTAAEIIGCTEGRVRQLIYSGDIDAVKANEKAWLVLRKSAEKRAKNPPAMGRPKKV